MKDLAGKVAVITGAASGMGRAMVRKAASEGMHVLAGDIDEAGLAASLGITQTPEPDPFVYARGRLCIEATAAGVQPIAVAD